MERDYLQNIQNIKFVVAKRKTTKSSIAGKAIRTLKIRIMNYISESVKTNYITYLQSFVKFDK